MYCTPKGRNTPAQHVQVQQCYLYYVVPSLNDVPLLLHNVTKEGQRLLSPFEIHCGDYVRMFNGYRQRTGPFRMSWCKQMVQQKISLVEDPSRRTFLQRVYDLLL